MDYYKYYHNQSGGELPFFRGYQNQRGHGLGSMFKSFYRWVVPIFKTHALPVLKEGAQSLGKETIKTLANVTTDAIEGKQLEDSIKQRSKEAFNSLVESAHRQMQSGSGIKRPKFVKSFQKKKKKRTKADIFDNEFPSQTI